MEKTIAEKTKEIKIKFELLENKLNDICLERKSAVRAIIRAIIKGDNVLMLGPPGTAKSLLAKIAGNSIKITEKDKQVFKKFYRKENPTLANNLQNYFEVLMSSFTTPEDWMGPISLKQYQKEDKYTRNMSGMLPSSFIVCVDEIFKGSKGNLNPLLKVANPGERTVYIAGTSTRSNVNVIIGCSNEEPNHKDLNALRDRFQQTIFAGPLKSIEAKKKMCGINGYRQTKKYDYDKNPLTVTDILNIRKYIANKIEIPEQIFELAVACQIKIQETLENVFSERTLANVVSDYNTGEPYPSLVKVEAWLQGNSVVNANNLAAVLADTAWKRIDDRNKVMDILSIVIKAPELLVTRLAQELENITEEFYEDKLCTDSLPWIERVNAVFQVFQKQKDKMFNPSKETKEIYKQFETTKAKIIENMIEIMSQRILDNNQ